MDGSYLNTGATRIWQSAWGNPWPNQQKGAISSVEIALDNHDDNGGSIDPEEYTYVCLRGMKEVYEALLGPTDIEDVLVIFKEYIWLRRLITEGSLRDAKAIAVKGHPGIGKTAFLLYLFLHLLEQKRPTAIQLVPSHYFIFDAEGAHVYAIDDVDSRLRACWALADSNSTITQPCSMFLSQARRVIQTSSATPDRRNTWLKQKNGSLVVFALPTPTDVMAILNELRLDTCAGIALLRKWGPSTRTILQILKAKNPGSAEEHIEDLAKAAASRVYVAPSTLLRDIQALTSTASTLFYLRPVRTDTDYIDVDIHTLDQAAADVPTKWLRDIFEAFRRSYSVKSPRGWADELHRPMCIV